jgi:GntR family transcriptional regulator
MPHRESEKRFFQQLQANLARRIAATPAGERLPTEPELARQLNVSRATLREAMRSFEAQGIIRRKQGVGTFVVDRAQIFETGLEVLESLETLAKRIGLSISMEALEINEHTASAEEAQNLAVAEGTALVKISRIIRTNQRPIAYLVDLLPSERFNPAELDEGFRGSVLDLLLRRNDLSPTRSQTEISAVAAPTDIARLLEIQRGDSMLLFVAQLFDADGSIIDYSHSYFLPGYFRFQVVRRVGIQL